MEEKNYKRLSFQERVIVETLLGEKRPKSFIASKLNRSRSTITREIEKWIIGTWDIDLNVQQDYEGGVVTSYSESTNQGKIVFREDGTAEDIGGNFNGSVFTYENTNTKLILTAGQTVTEYVVESFSTSKFEFSITTPSGTNKSVERWYISK